MELDLIGGNLLDLGNQVDLGARPKMRSGSDKSSWRQQLEAKALIRSAQGQMHQTAGYANPSRGNDCSGKGGGACENEEITGALIRYWHFRNRRRTDGRRMDGAP